MSVKTCVAVDCSKPQHARGYCNGHYYRCKKYGTPDGSAPPGLWRPTALRFWEKVRIDPTSCYEWTGSTDENGYGQLRIAGKLRGAHRISFALFRGGFQSLRVLHKCDNPLCVRPSHLFLGTQLDNMRDMHAKKRRVYRTGENHARAKLTDTQVDEIQRCAAPYRLGLYSALAREFGVSSRHISTLVRGQRKATS